MLRASGRILADLLSSLSALAREGTTLASLDAKARELLASAHAKSAFLGYTPEGARAPYPSAICTSVNGTVVHGLPTGYALCRGDLLSIDAGVDYRGYFTDAAVTVGIEPILPQARRLLEATEDALRAAVGECRSGQRLGDLGAAIESVVRSAGFHIIRGLTGHGVGFLLHEDPTVHNYGRRGEGLELKPGLVLAIEPMVSVGSPDIVSRPDGSYTTRDGSLSAHFEHTVVITANGCEILTAR